MRLRLLLILAAFILAACGQSEPPAKGEAGPPGPPGPAGAWSRWPGWSAWSR
jgi:hypothetical protein